MTKLTAILSFLLVVLLVSIEFGSIQTIELFSPEYCLYLDGVRNIKCNESCPRERSLMRASSQTAACFITKVFLNDGSLNHLYGCQLKRLLCKKSNSSKKFCAFYTGRPFDPKMCDWMQKMKTNRFYSFAKKNDSDNDNDE